MKTFVVIGLGRFGTALATELSALGHEVLAMDMDEDRVQEVADTVTHAVAADARNPAVLRSLGMRNYDCAIVAVGGEIGTSTLITLNLKELGMREVICKAKSHVHRKVLEKIGADRVLFPENEMGVKLAQGLSSSNFGILELEAPDSWVGKTIRDLDVRNAYHVTIIAIRGADTGKLDVSPRADKPLEKGDKVVALGRSEAINLLHEVK